MHSGIPSRPLIVYVTRDYDSRKHSTIFLDRDWFVNGDMFETSNGMLTINTKFHRVSESDTVYTVIGTGTPHSHLQLKAGDTLKFVGNIEPKEVKPTLMVHDVTIQGKLVYESEKQNIKEKPLTSSDYSMDFPDELLYLEEELVPSQFFGLNDYKQKRKS